MGKPFRYSFQAIPLWYLPSWTLFVAVSSDHIQPVMRNKACLEILFFSYFSRYWHQDRTFDVLTYLNAISNVHLKCFSMHKTAARQTCHKAGKHFAHYSLLAWRLRIAEILQVAFLYGCYNLHIPVTSDRLKLWYLINLYINAIVLFFLLPFYLTSYRRLVIYLLMHVTRGLNVIWKL